MKALVDAFVSTFITDAPTCGGQVIAGPFWGIVPSGTPMPYARLTAVSGADLVQGFKPASGYGEPLSLQLSTFWASLNGTSDVAIAMNTLANLFDRQTLTLAGEATATPALRTIPPDVQADGTQNGNLEVIRGVLVWQYVTAQTFGATV